MEFVLVVKRQELFDLHYPHGFLSSNQHEEEISRYVERARSRSFFVERRHAEEDASLQQIIPYILIVRGDEVLLLRRSKKGGDARLHDKLSIGVGGHINPPDAEDGDPITACARREMDEEIEVDTEVSPVAVGIINDDSNPVGSVHFGLVYVGRVPAGTEVRVRETELLSAEFVSRAHLKDIATDPSKNLETWSQLITARIDEVV